MSCRIPLFCDRWHIQIRWNPARHSGFRPYNVPGLDAVELHLKSHDVRRIRTDDPQRLADALKALPQQG
ncbi:MAG TPA: hypothetical protein VGM09_17750 [Bradyrhizobium sp.]